MALIANVTKEWIKKKDFGFIVQLRLTIHNDVTNQDVGTKVFTEDFRKSRGDTPETLEARFVKEMQKAIDEKKNVNPDPTNADLTALMSNLEARLVI